MKYFVKKCLVIFNSSYSSNGLIQNPGRFHFSQDLLKHILQSSVFFRQFNEKSVHALLHNRIGKAGPGYLLLNGSPCNACQDNTSNKKTGFHVMQGEEDKHLAFYDQRDDRTGADGSSGNAVYAVIERKNKAQK
jgi:hypothetical protein